MLLGMTARLFSSQDSIDQQLEAQLSAFSEAFPQVNVLVLRPEDLPHAPDAGSAPHRLGPKTFTPAQQDARALVLDDILHTELPQASFGDVEISAAAQMTSPNVIFEDVLSVSTRGCVAYYDLYGSQNALILLEPRWWRQSHDMAAITGLPVASFASLADRPSAVFSLAHELNHIARQQSPETLTQFHFEQSGDLAGLAAVQTPEDRSFYRDWRLLSSLSASVSDDKMAYAFGLTLADPTKQDDAPEDHILAFIDMKRAAVAPLLPDTVLELSPTRLFNGIVAKRPTAEAHALLSVYQGDVTAQKLQQRLGHLAEAVGRGTLSPLAAEMSVATLNAAQRRLPRDFLSARL